MANTGQNMGSQSASEVKDRAKEMAGNVVSAVGERVEEATSSVGGGMQSLAGTIRERAPQGGMMGTAASSVAGALESGGRYLQEHDLRDIGNDVSNFIRRNPIPAVLISMGIGFLLARATRRS
jgi:hypothetical protein